MLKDIFYTPTVEAGAGATAGPKNKAGSGLFRLCNITNDMFTNKRSQAKVRVSTVYLFYW